MKKNYNNKHPGIDFELELQRSEKEYDDLMRDFKVVVGWNADIADRYNYLADLLPTPEEVDTLLYTVYARYSDVKTWPLRNAIIDAELHIIGERINKLQALKVAVRKLQDNPVSTAKEFVKAKHVYDEVQVHIEVHADKPWMKKCDEYLIKWSKRFHR